MLGFSIVLLFFWCIRVVQLAVVFNLCSVICALSSWFCARYFCLFFASSWILHFPHFIFPRQLLLLFPIPDMFSPAFFGCA